MMETFLQKIETGGQSNDNNAQSTEVPNQPSEQKTITDEEAREIAYIGREFNCRFLCESVRTLRCPDNNVEYLVGGKLYGGKGRHVNDDEIKELDQCKTFNCNSIWFLKNDRYGHEAVKLFRDIPCFDSGDREWNSMHSLKLFHNEGKIHAVFCVEGYSISELVIVENVTPDSENLKTLLRECGFPVTP